MSGARIGHGYDVHRLVEGRKLILGGVDIPWERGLLGHSDADVLTHAVMDALLGAAALGDIGKIAAPGLAGFLEPFFEGGAHVFDLVRIAAGKSLGEVNDPVGSLCHAPVAVLGDILLGLQPGGRINLVVAAAQELPDVIGLPVSGGLLAHHLLYQASELGGTCLRIRLQLVYHAGVGLVGLLGRICGFRRVLIYHAAPLGCGSALCGLSGRGFLGSRCVTAIGGLC